jgi:hypothetical protein
MEDREKVIAFTRTCLPTTHCLSNAPGQITTCARDLSDLDTEGMNVDVELCSGIVDFLL